MTRVLILGGGGMIGQKLAQHLLDDGLPDGGDTPQITLHDLGFPANGVAIKDRRIGNISIQAVSLKLAAERFDVIYALASVVSGEAEQNFDKGWQTNLWPLWHLLEALRAQHRASDGAYVPRLIFTSSIAVFGGPYPARITDDFLSSPQTSYGAQKAACELLIQDFARKGFIHGMSLRLPTICVRPGKPNLAASSFFSGIIREPLNGETALLPVPDTVRHWHASPKAAAGFLRHAAGLGPNALGGRTALNLPGLSCTVAEQIEALRDVAGSDVAARIRPEPDAAVMQIVQGWPRDFAPERATRFGFKAESSFREIIETYIAEDLPHDPRQA